MKVSFYVKEEHCCLQKQHSWCLEDGTAKQAKLVDCSIFQEMVLPMGFQSKTHCADK